MYLPIFRDDNQQFMLMQSRWSSVLQPVLNQPFNSGIIRKNISLSAGVNTVNHLLGRTPQGWALVDIDSASTVYRSEPFNELTLTLTASADAVVSLLVF